MNRRHFLQRSLLGVSLAGMHSTTLRASGNKPLGVALVGLGYYSTELLAPALQLTKYCRLTGIVTGTPSKAVAWKSRYQIPDKNIYNYENFNAVANNDEIDVMYIVLPPSMHAEYSIRAAEAGKHVWCEKPMALNVVECQRMIDACRRNKRKLTIGYRMQHEPNTQKVIEFSKTRPYGKIKNVRAEAGYRESRVNHWKLKKEMGGGAMYDMGVYPLNASRYATGWEPIAVTAKQSTTRPEIFTAVDETMEFLLEFPNGVQAECRTSFAMGLNNLYVDCERGWYELSPFQAYRDIHGRTSDGMLLNAEIPNQQARQMDNDALAILNGTGVLVPGEEGLRDIRVVEAVHRSATEGRRIELS